MQQAQHNHLGDEMINAIAKVSTSPAVQTATARNIFTTMGRVLRSAGIGFVQLSVEQFLARPRLIKPEGLALALVDVLANGGWTLLSRKKEDGTYDITVFDINEESLAQSRFAEPGAEELAELQRQLAVIGHEGSRMFTLVVLTQPIQGYEYFLTDIERAEKQAREAAEALELARAAATPAPQTEPTPVAEAVKEVVAEATAPAQAVGGDPAITEI